jgi:hypothetical protein
MSKTKLLGSPGLPKHRYPLPFDSIHRRNIPGLVPRHGERLFFGYVFAKSSLANIEDDRLKWFKKVSREYLEYTDDELEARIKEGWIEEIMP